MFTHPTIHIEIARQRQEDALARAERDRLAHALRPSATLQLRFVARLAAVLTRSALRRYTPARRTVQDRLGEAEA
jgi:hypothetical protein